MEDCEGFSDEELDDVEYSVQLAAENEEFEWRLQREIQRKRKEIPALVWLAHQMKIAPDNLDTVLNMVRNDQSPYRMITLDKPDGGKRRIFIPIDPLKRIQRKIVKCILSDFQTGPNCYGFSGGSIVEAIEPHLQAGTILYVDIRDAFSSSSAEMVMSYLTEGRVPTFRYDYNGKSWPYCYDEDGERGLHYGSTRRLVFEGMLREGRMSWSTARIIVDLTTYPVIGSTCVLPQGAPTSPWLFDMVCKKLDEKLTAFAQKVGGKYTRYADNIFFSMDQDEFPNPVKNAVLRMIRMYGRFRPHKIRVRRMTKGAVKLLGLNVIEGQIHNTREFKRRLRLAIHHVEWFLNNRLKDTPEFDTAWHKLQGLMAFARIDTLPPKLLESYYELEDRIFKIN